MNFYKVFILILTSFILWAVFTDYIGKIDSDVRWNVIDNVDISTNEDSKFSLVDSVFSLVEKNFYSIEDINNTELVEWAVRWMIEGLWDTNSEFLNPEKTERFLQSLSWDFEWIGAVVEKVNEWVKVERLIQWWPALAEWVRSWDIILTANGINLAELDLFDAVENIRWPAETTVILEILRPWNDDIIEKNITRKNIQIPSVEFSMIDENNFWYLILNQFGENSSQEFRQAIIDAKESQVDWLIIDLRNNGWGFLESSVEILSEFIPRWEKLVSIRYRDPSFDTTFRSNNTWEVFEIPIVVLINENSASAAEITAWALREYNKAILIWKQSFWKGSVQQPFDIWDSLLKLTVAHWYTPLWVSIELEWISPDITVEFTEEDFENNYDRQLEEAKRLLEIFISKNTIWLSIEEFMKTGAAWEDSWE